MTRPARQGVYELYGRVVQFVSARDISRIKRGEHCPFLGRRCLKVRKSDPKQTIGTCSVLYQGLPHIVCPFRFLEQDIVFRDCVRLLDRCDEYRVVPEVSLPGGSIDYVIAGTKSTAITDFTGVELQSLDTTGSVWEAREDVGRAHTSTSYKYGINWKMTGKTTLVQLHHKAETFEVVGKHLVLALQDCLLDRLLSTFNSAAVRDSRLSDSVHIHSYGLAAFDDAVRLVLNRTLSTTASGVRVLLDLGVSAVLSIDELTRRIQAKMDAARPLMP